MPDIITWYIPKYKQMTSQRRFKKYYVKHGETIYHISTKFFRTPFRWREIADFNNLDNPLYLPEVLNIPISGEA